MLQTTNQTECNPWNCDKVNLNGGLKAKVNPKHTLARKPCNLMMLLVTVCSTSLRCRLCSTKGRMRSTALSVQTKRECKCAGCITLWCEVIGTKVAVAEGSFFLGKRIWSQKYGQRISVFQMPPRYQHFFMMSSASTPRYLRDDICLQVQHHTTQPTQSQARSQETTFSAASDGGPFILPSDPRSTASSTRPRWPVSNLPSRFRSPASRDAQKKPLENDVKRMAYPLIVEHGLLENPPFMDDFPSQKPPFIGDCPLPRLIIRG